MRTYAYTCVYMRIYKLAGACHRRTQVTGQMNEATYSKMKQPRCGVADVDSEMALNNRKKRYTLRGNGRRTVYCVVYTAYIIHCTMYTVHRTLKAVHCTPYTECRILYAVHCTPYIVRRTLYAVHCTPYTVRRTLYGLQACTLFPIAIFSIIYH